jgi:hypothetical protein
MPPFLCFGLLLAEPEAGTFARCKSGSKAKQRSVSPPDFDLPGLSYCPGIAHSAHDQFPSPPDTFRARHSRGREGHAGQTRTPVEQRVLKLG